MPYRRLPNTDKARLAALEKAVAMEHECDVDKQAASYKTLNEARVLLRRFKSAVEQFQYCYTAQAEANRVRNTSCFTGSTPKILPCPS